MFGIPDWALGVGFILVAVSIAKALAGEIQKTSRNPRLYVQVNTGAEPQKAGIAPADADAFDEFRRGPGAW